MVVDETVRFLFGDGWAGRVLPLAGGGYLRENPGFDDYELRVAWSRDDSFRKYDYAILRFLTPPDAFALKVALVEKLGMERV